MTEKQTVMGPRGIQKRPGWFSWRHQTADAHVAAVEQYIATHATARARIARRERKAGR